MTTAGGAPPEGGPGGGAPESVEVWFSFRSPFSWLALHRLARLVEHGRGGTTVAGVPVALRFAAVYPRDPSMLSPDANPGRFRYALQDFGRFAAAYGLRPAMPASLDTDWIRPSAAFQRAQDEGAALPFALGIFAARWTQRRDPAADDAIADAARAAGLDPGRLVGAADDPRVRARVEADLRRAGESGLFGVPTFLWRDVRFWGNDRLDWLLRALREARGLPVPDLARDPLASPVHS